MEETNRFKAVMEQKDDVELIKIVTAEKKDYQPEAIFAAEEEIKKRNISVSMYQDFSSKVNELIEIQKNLEETKRKLPLQTWIKVVAFILPATIFFFIGAGLMMFGYQKRGKELCLWTLFGCLLYIFIFAVFFSINFHHLP